MHLERADTYLVLCYFDHVAQHVSTGRGRGPEHGWAAKESYAPQYTATVRKGGASDHDGHIRQLRLRYTESTTACLAWRMVDKNFFYPFYTSFFFFLIPFLLFTSTSDATQTFSTISLSFHTLCILAISRGRLSCEACCICTRYQLSIPFLRPFFWSIVSI